MWDTVKICKERYRTERPKMIQNMHRVPKTYKHHSFQVHHKLWLCMTGSCCSFLSHRWSCRNKCFQRFLANLYSPPKRWFVTRTYRWALTFEVHQPLAGYPEEVQPHGCARECHGIATVLCTWINILLVFVPLGIYSHMQEWSLGCAWDTVRRDNNLFSSTM